MNKQIEEMAKALGDTWVVDLEGNPHDLSEVLMRCDLETIAEQMYALNYHKTTDVAREIFAELELKAPFFCANQVAYEHFNEELAELKKKYESEGAE